MRGEQDGAPVVPKSPDKRPELAARRRIEWYLATGEPFGKAGGYAIQGAAAVLVSSVTGSVSNVIGLPLHLVIELARGMGVELLAPLAAG